MKKLFLNPEYRVHLYFLLLIQILIFTLLIININTNLNKISSEVAKNNAAIVGKIISKTDSPPEEVINLITKGASKKEISEGMRILEQYGYISNLKLRDIFPDIYIGINRFYILLISLSLLLNFLLVNNRYKHVYNNMYELSRRFLNVLNDDYKKKENHYAESEFSVLVHRFNQMSAGIREHMTELEKQKKFLRDIISDISHQLKTPLSSLTVFNDIMLEGNNIPKEKIYDFLKQSSVQLEKMNRLIISLLKIARVETGTILYNKKQIDVKHPVDLSVRALENMIRGKNITVNILSKNNAKVLGDKEWLSECFTNIIKNCIEHSESKSKIDITINATSLYSRVTVRDYGEGIPDNDIPNIFNRFYKGSNSVKMESVGIGLSLSKKIVQEHNGKIQVNNKVKPGCEFIITFYHSIN